MGFRGQRRRLRITSLRELQGAARDRGDAVDAFLRAAAFWFLLLSIIGGGCEKTPSRPKGGAGGAVSLHVQVRFIGIGDSTRSAMVPSAERGASGVAGAPGGFAASGTVYSIESVRARAFEILGDESDTLRASADVVVPAGATQFALELNVPPAAHYRLYVDASGSRRLLDGRSSGSGFLFLGDAAVDDVSGGASRDVSIDLRDIVPLLSQPTELAADRYLLSWTPVPGATRYWLSRTPGVGSPIAVYGVTDTVHFPAANGPASTRPALDAYAYRVQAELPPRSLRSAPSESVSVALPPQVPPAAVVDLSAVWISDSVVLLSWTAPGDDGDVGQASTYDIRYSDQPITGLDETWDAATHATNPGRPKPAGSSESLTIGGLSASAGYWFALRTADEVPNWSDISNIVNVSPRIGACCSANGSCAVTTSAACADQQGQFLGIGTTCAPNPCPQPVGACCFTDGHCTVATSAQCAAQSGTYVGDATTCLPNPCAQPTGACCFADGRCQLLTAGECASQGGAYQGNGTACDPNPCTQPTGACCFADGHCAVTRSTDCLSQSGTYQGNATVCDPNPCPQPTGACCFHDGHCASLTTGACSAQGGTYLGNATACDPNPCAQPTGACCFHDGHCAVETQAQCTTDGGASWTIDGVCDPNPCPIADLLITSGNPAVDPTTVIAGDSVSVAAVTIANSGTAAAGSFVVGYYLSLDPTITSDDVPLGNVPISGLDIEGEAILPAIRLEIPLNTPAGSYYLGVFVDDANAVPESNESNNTAATPLDVQTPPGPR